MRSDDLLAAALLEQQPRVRAPERLEDHQLRAQQPDAVDVHRRGARSTCEGSDRLTSRRVPVTGAADAATGAGARVRCSVATAPATTTPRAGVDRHDLAVAQHLAWP